MLVLVFAAVLDIQPDLDQLRQAAVALLALQGMAFGIDLWTLAELAGRPGQRTRRLPARAAWCSCT